MKYLLDVLSHKQKTERTPIWFMRQAGRYLPEYRKIREQSPDFLECIRSPECVVEITLQPLKRFDLDAAIIFSDILIVPFALGQAVEFGPGEGPLLEEIQSRKDFKRLSLNHFQSGISPTLEAISKVKALLQENISLIGFAGSPWTVLTYMIEGGGSKDFFNTLELYYTQPALFQDLRQLVEDATILYLKEQIKAGVDVIQLFDSWAGSVPNALFDELVVFPHQRIIQELKAEFPHFPMICFPRGIGEKLDHFVLQCQPDAISLDSMRNLVRIDNVVMQGGVDPAVLSVGGDFMEQQVKTTLDFYQDKPYIANLGHGIHPSTPVRHVEALIQYIRDYKS